MQRVRLPARGDSEKQNQPSDAAQLQLESGREEASTRRLEQTSVRQRLFRSNSNYVQKPNSGSLISNRNNERKFNYLDFISSFFR